MEGPRLEWSAAAVRDGTLTVPIAGDRPRGWKSTFERTVRLLGGGSWGEVSLKKEKVKVADVPEGSEDELRFFLEGVVQQANATHVDTDDADEAADDADDPADAADDDDADARMTPASGTPTAPDARHIHVVARETVPPRPAAPLGLLGQGHHAHPAGTRVQL